MLGLTVKGHDMLAQLESDYSLEHFMAELQKPAGKFPMPQNTKQPLSVFVSHSAKDEKLAGALVTLLRSALNIPANEIRCTSVNGYRLPVGADTEERLRQEVNEAKVLVGLITPSSMASAYVMFELGARWGVKLPLAPLLGAGAGTELLRGPLGSLNALKCEDVSQLHQFINNLATYLNIHAPSPADVYQSSLDEVIRISKEARPPTMVSPVVMPTASSNAQLIPSVPQLRELDEQEIKVIKFVAHRNNSGVIKDSVSQELNIHILKADQLLSRLEKRGLLYSTLRMGMPLIYRLSSVGRDFVIENKFV